MLYYNLEEHFKNEYSLNEERKIVLSEFIKLANENVNTRWSQYEIIQDKLEELRQYAKDKALFVFSVKDILQALIKTQNLDPSKVTIDVRIHSFLNQKVPQDYKEFLSIIKQIGYNKDGLNTSLTILYEDKVLCEIKSCIKSEDFEELYKNIYFEERGVCQFVNMFYCNGDRARFDIIEDLDLSTLSERHEELYFRNPKTSILNNLIYERVYLPNAILNIDDPELNNKNQLSTVNEESDYIDIEIENQ